VFCSHCGEKIDQEIAFCPKCGIKIEDVKPIYPAKKGLEGLSTTKLEEFKLEELERVATSLTNKVTVVDIKMPFWSMVVFMIKWAIAAIPAILILVVLGTILGTMLVGFLGGLVGLGR
jgi:uncharacterized membrane protein YvbJ